MISNNDSQMIDVVDNSVAHLLFCDVEINGLSGCVRRRIRRWTTQSSAAGVSGGRGRSITVDVGGHSSRRRRACASGAVAASPYSSVDIAVICGERGRRARSWRRRGCQQIDIVFL